jgi:SpoVK/Ycf46/Vps4 family AAA+-type ATPase
MINFKFQSNTPSIDNDKLLSIGNEVQKRLENIDFSKFEIWNIQLYILVNEDKNSLELTIPLNDGVKHLIFQNTPSQYAYNSSFEAKLSTIRLRIQNMTLGDITNLDNIIFIFDFSQEHVETTFDGKEKSRLSSLIKKKSIESHDDEKRKKMFVPIEPKYKLEKVIMTESMREDIQDALSIIRHRKKIYDDWGFSEVDPQPRAILSFFGSPGTGKTMCAHGIATEMQSQILCINYAEIESKWAGESPKNLISAFNAAQEHEAILFFDEADSFLGKRISNIQSGHDQSINSLRSQMLIQLENFEGIVIFATNLVKNFDKAFETRILKHIKFELPDDNAKIEIYKTIIPSKVPFKDELTDIDFADIAKESINFSGRDIRNAILDTLSKGARESLSEFSKLHFVETIKKRVESKNKIEEEISQENENRKQEIMDALIKESKMAYNKSLIDIAIYAAWSDGEIDLTEKHLITETAKALGVSEPSFDSKVSLEPIASVCCSFVEKEQQKQALDMACRIIAVDNIIKETELSFLKQLYCILGYKIEFFNEIKEYVECLATVNTKWNQILN